MTGSPVSAGQNPGGGSAGLLGIFSYWFTSGQMLLWAMLMVEGTWFYLWMVWLGLWGGFGLGEVPLGLVSILFLLWISYHTVQILGQQRWSTKKARVVAGCLILALLALMVRLENGGGYGLLDPGWARFAAHGLVNTFPSAIQASILGGIYLWWRGYRLAVEGLHQDQVLHSFLVGLLGLFLALLAWEVAFRSSAGFPTTRGHALAVTVAFFIGGVSALAISHLMTVGAEIARLGDIRPDFRHRWPAVLLAVIAGMLVAGVVMGSLFSLNVWSPLLALLSLVSYALAFLLYYLMLPIAYLAAWGIYGVKWLIALRGPVKPPTITLPDLSSLRKIAQEGERAPFPVWVTLLKWALLLILLTLAVRFLARLLLGVRRRAEAQAGFTEVHESVGSWRDFVQDVLQGLFCLLFWFQRQGRRVRLRARTRPYSRHAARNQEMEVRELYATLLEEARTAGFPRIAGETPFEYLVTLERRLPAERDALERITQEYVRVRYGEQTVSVQERGLLNQLWRGVYAAMRGLGGADKQPANGGPTTSPNTC